MSERGRGKEGEWEREGKERREMKEKGGERRRGNEEEGWGRKEEKRKAGKGVYHVFLSFLSMEVIRLVPERPSKRQ